MIAELEVRQDAYKRMESSVIQQTVRKLFEMMQGRFDRFPTRYVVFDLETTGLDFKKDLVWQLGYCLVQDRKLTVCGNHLLDWTRHPAIDQAWLKQRLLETKEHVEQKDGKPTGKTYHINYDKMHELGADPVPVLQEYLAWFKELREQKYFFVAHNGLAFDVPMLKAHFQRFCQDTFEWDPYTLFDTGMVCKAAQSSLTPWQGETPGEFFRRAYSQRLKNIFWSLDRYAVPTFGLAEKYGLDMHNAHDAGFDARVTHLLLEHWHDMVNAQS
jgi:DNA polymerase III epsilon subunit-like protein